MRNHFNNALFFYPDRIIDSIKILVLSQLYHPPQKERFYSTTIQFDTEKEIKNLSFRNFILNGSMMNGRRWKINTTTLWCREKSHEPWNLVSQFRRRDSISLNRWLVYRLQLLNHRVSSSSSCRVVGHRDHNLFRFFRLARRLSIFLFSITSVRARHPQDLRRRRSSLPTGNSLEYRPIPLSSFHRSNDIFPLTKPRFRSQSVYNRFDTTKWIRSVPFHEFFLSLPPRCCFQRGKWSLYAEFSNALAFRSWTRID